MGELINQKKLLSTPAERQRLLEEVPEIVADAEDEKETGLAITAAGEAYSSGVTPVPVLHSPVAQDSSKTQAIDINKDESNQSKHNKSNVSSGTPTELTRDQARVGIRHDDVQAERDGGSSNRPSRFKRPECQGVWARVG